MVYVQGGSFMMGATYEQGSDAYGFEKPAHQVTVSSFYICRYEVTQEEWQAIMGSNPSHFKGVKRPVESVSWNDCQIFIRKLNEKTGRNFRLPTEEEWEYAARGGSRSNGYKYAGSNNINSVAWYYDNSGNCTHNVGMKHPNELGLYDMCGNVYEWCQNLWYTYSSSAPNLTETDYVGRGGCWAGVPRFCRVSIRYNFAPTHRDYYVGLRLAL